MKEDSESIAINWCNIDRKHALTGEFPKADGVDVQLYNSQLQMSNARFGHGLLLTYPQTNPLLKARTMLAKGDVDSALELIHEQKQISKNNVDFIELLMEEARALNLKGKWQAGLKLVSECIALNPQPVSRMALLQMSALQLFELGRPLEALAEIEKAESLAEIFPYSTSKIYLEATKVKVLSRISSIEKAKTLLINMWVDYIELETPNPDYLSVLLRCEVDMLRLENKITLIMRRQAIIMKTN